MKNNRIRDPHILSIIGVLILTSTLSSCAMLGLSSAKRVEHFFLAAEALYKLESYVGAIKKYKVALQEFEKPGVTLGFRPHIDKNFPILVNHRIAICYSKLAEQSNRSKELYDRAITYVEKAVLLSTDNRYTAGYKNDEYKAESYYLWGELLHKTGKFELAIEKFSELIERFPESSVVEEASYRVGLFYHDKKNYELSRRAFFLILKKFPSSKFKHEAHYRIAEMFLNEENYEKAYWEFARSLESRSYSSDFREGALYYAVYCLSQLGRHDEALELYIDFITLYPGSQYTKSQYAAAAHLSIGKGYFRKQQYKEALSTYELALQNTEKQTLKTEIRNAIAEVYFAMGKMYFGEKDYEKAVHNCELALQNTEKQTLKTEIRNAIAEVYFAMGKMYFREKDYKKAVHSYELALQNTEKQTLKTEIRIDTATIHFTVGKMYFREKDYKKAVHSYELALQNTEKQTLKTEIQLAMAFAYLNHGDAKNAIVTCKHMLSVTKTDLGTMLTIDPTAGEKLTIAKGIQLYLEAENTTFLAGYKGAIAKYNAALIKIQNSIPTTVGAEYQANLNYILGTLFYKVERFESAEQVLTKVIENFPDSDFVDDAWYAIGDMNYKLQSYTACRDAFRRILKIFPNSDLQDDAQYFVAKSLLEELDYEGAYLAFDGLTTKRFQKYPDFQDDARYHAAYCLNLLGRDDMAIRRYENFLEHYPKSPYRVDAYFDLGTIYARQQNYESARSNYALAMQYTDDQALLAEIQMAIGHTHYNQGNYKNAIVAHTSLLEKYPESDFIIEAKLGIANSHFRMRTWQEAADAYERVINEHPEAVNFTPYCAYQVGEAHYGLAIHHSEQDKTELAVKNFHKALEWYQRIVDDFPMEDSNNLGEIIELLITSLTRMRNDSSVPEELQSLAQLKKGDSYLSTKQYGKALAQYNTFVQMFPNSTRGPSVQDRIKQVQESIISKNLRQKKVRTTVEIPIEQQIAQKSPSLYCAHTHNRYHWRSNGTGERFFYQRQPDCQQLACC